MAEGQGRFFPEQGNRQPPRGMERRGGTRLNVTGAPPVPGFRPGGVTATPDRPTAPTLPRPDRVQPPPEKAPPKPKKRHTGRNIALAGTVLGVLGAGAYEVYQNVPAVHRAVDSAFLDHLKGKSSPSEASVFNNLTSKGTVENSNSIIINDVSVIKNTETVPSGPNVKHDINLLMPIKGLPASGRIDYSKDFTGKNDNSPMFAEDIRQYAKANGVKDSMVFRNIPKDHIIVSPTDGYLIFQRVRKNLPENVVDGAMIFYNAPDGTQQIILLGEESGRFLTPLMQTEFYTGDASQIEKIKVPIKRGQEILKTTTDNSNINMLSYGIPSPSSLTDYPTNINLISSVDPSTGQQKIIILGG